MSLKKYKKSDKNIHNLAPRRLISNHERQFWLYEDGWKDYYDYWGYYYYDYYADERREEFAVPVYSEYQSNGRVVKRLIGQYLPDDVWVDSANRRNKRIDDLLGEDLTGKNTIGNYVVKEIQKNE
jgi:hypothetical protein